MRWHRNDLRVSYLFSEFPLFQMTSLIIKVVINNKIKGPRVNSLRVFRLLFTLSKRTINNFGRVNAEHLLVYLFYFI